MAVGDSRTGDIRMVQALLDVDRGLTEWEVRFAESLGRQVFDRLNTLTDRQRAAVRRILDRIGDKR